MSRIWSFFTRGCRARPTNSPSQTTSQCTEDNENVTSADCNADGNKILKHSHGEKKNNGYSYLLLSDDKIVLSWKRDQRNYRNYGYNSFYNAADSVVYGAASALLLGQIARFFTGIVHKKVAERQLKGEDVADEDLLNSNLRTIQCILPKVPSLPSVSFPQTAHAAGGSDVSVSLPADKNDRSNFAERSTAQDCISSEKQENIAPICGEDLEEFYANTKQCLGMTYNMEGVKNYKGGNYSDAFQFFKLGSEGGYKQAQFNLALCYQQGKGTKQNLKQAKKEYYRASLQGHVIAQYNLALILLDERNWENIRKALFWLEKAADNGLVQAQALLGSYTAQVGTRQYDMKKAVKMFQLATEQLLDHPICVVVNDIAVGGGGLGFDYWAQAQRRHRCDEEFISVDPLSTYHLAQCYEHGLGGLEVDTSKAFDLYTSAAGYGNTDAHFKMAMILLNGCQEIEKNEELAKEILKKAEELGHEKSAKKLAQLKRKAELKTVARDLNAKYRFHSNISALNTSQFLLSGLVKKLTTKSHIQTSPLYDLSYISRHVPPIHRVSSLPGLSLYRKSAISNSDVSEKG